MAANKQFIPNSLKKHRRLCGFSQDDIKNRLKLKSTSMISRWERGLTMPSGENLLKLSVLYKTMVNELYYTLSKQYQVRLFPAERAYIKPRKRKVTKCLDRGP
jgi:transcriptional regulator with XRE-family HTH domain